MKYVFELFMIIYRSELVVIVVFFKSNFFFLKESLDRKRVKDFLLSLKEKFFRVCLYSYMLFIVFLCVYDIDNMFW